MLSDESERFRPWNSRRDPGLAAAVRRAERASEPKPVESDFLGRTRAGFVKRRNGSLFVPGKYFPQSTLEALPFLEEVAQ